MMFTPCCPNAGPTGGEGFASPAGIWIFIFAVIFFAIGYPLELFLGYLFKVELNRCGSPEDAYQDSDLALVGLDIVYHTAEVLEWTFGN
jgi:hypothetical protein